MQIVEEKYAWHGRFGLRADTDAIVLHHAAATTASPQQIHNAHLANGWTGIGYHYYVRKDGTVYRGRPENVSGGHTLNENFHTIGVCFEGNFETETMSDAQLNAGRELIADIQTRYGALYVTKHSHWNSTACPGTNFRFEEMTEAVPDEPANEDVVSDWAYESWLKATEKGIVDGTRPQGAMTREMFVVAMSRLGLI